MARTVRISGAAGATDMFFTDQNDHRSYVTTNQTFVITGNAAGATTFRFTPALEAISLEDGRKIRIDCGLSSLTVVSSTIASKNAGSIWIEEDNGYKCEWRVRTCTINNVTTPTALTIVMERADNPMITCTLTTVGVEA